MVVVDILRRKVVEDIRFLQAQTRFYVESFFLPHVIQVPRVDVLAPPGPVAQSGVNNGLAALSDGIRDRDPADLHLGAAFQPPAAEGFDIIRQEGRRVFDGDQVGGIKRLADGRAVVEPVFLILPAAGILGAEFELMARPIEGVAIFGPVIHISGDFLFPPVPVAVALVGQQVHVSHLRRVDMSFAVEDTADGKGVVFVEGPIHTAFDDELGLLPVFGHLGGNEPAVVI